MTDPADIAELRKEAEYEARRRDQQHSWFAFRAKKSEAPEVCVKCGLVKTFSHMGGPGCGSYPVYRYQREAYDGISMPLCANEWARHAVEITLPPRGGMPAKTLAIMPPEMAARRHDDWLNYEGALSDLESAIEVLAKRINGEMDLPSAAVWMALNYPEHAKRLLHNQPRID